MKHSIKNKFVSIIAAVIFVFLFFVSVYQLIQQSHYSVDQVIAKDVVVLKSILEQIDKDCGIINFEHVRNYIDFLTVKEFVGSEVGAMNLRYPQQWKGPYLKDNPTIQEKMYIILRNNNSYYIIPDNGVVLGNGKRIGKDIILDHTVDIQKLLNDNNGLVSSYGALGVQVDIAGSSIGKIAPKFT